MQDCHGQAPRLEAPDRKECLGAFSVKDQESIRLVVAIAEEEDSPVALSVNADLVGPGAIKVLSAAANDAADHSSVPVALILGHARHLDLVKQALDWGFSSVMFDGSFLPLANNVELTARAVTLAARAGVRLEGAIGAFSDFGKDSTGECLICALAAKFARETGIDSLAVSLPLDWGRGVKLDMELLAKLCQSVTVGLSLHDASLLALQDIRGAMAAGVSRLSFDTCLRKAATENLREQSASWLREVVRQTMRLFRQESHGTPNAP